MHKVVTMSDANYFSCGKLFLETRNRVNADFVLYGPDLTDGQVSVLKSNDIEYVEIDSFLFRAQMQFLKFSIVIDELIKCRKVTFVDFDTFFINDWSRVFDYNFDFGITVRNDLVKKRYLRAYANGGVIFAKSPSRKLITFARKIILSGDSKFLPEYDRIWKTLEIGRPEHKTHYRTTLRWWVDQVFLSSLVLKHFEDWGYCEVGLEPIVFEFLGTNIGLFGCDYYNLVESEPVVTDEKNVYIRHLKSVGRKILGMDITKEKR